MKTKLSKLVKKYDLGGNYDPSYNGTTANTAPVDPNIKLRSQQQTEQQTISAINPSYGGIFAGISAIYGPTKTKQAKMDEYQYQQQLKQFNNNQSQQAAEQRGSQLQVNPMYSLTSRKDGGRLDKLSNNTVLAKGASHEEGGIKLPAMNAEIEGGETMKKLKGGGTYVMSDTLVNPTTGNTFAKDDKKLSTTKGKIENLNTSRFKGKALDLINKKEQSLLEVHEGVRNQMGLSDGSDSNNEVAEYPNGGRITAKDSTNSKGQSQPILMQGNKPLELKIGSRPYKPERYDDGGTINSEDQKYFDNEPLLNLDGTSYKKKQLSNDPRVIGDYNEPSINTKTGNKGYGSKLAGLSPYADNITGAIYNYQRSKTAIPNKRTLTGLTPNLVDYGQAIRDVRDQNRYFDKGVDQTNANSGNANIMKAFALGEQNRGIARISQDENNVNTQIKNEFAARNKDIESQNNETTFGNQERQRLGKDDIRREYQQNIVNANSKFQGQRFDSKLSKLDEDQNNIDLANASPETLAYLKSQGLLEGKKSKKMGGKLSKMYC